MSQRQTLETLVAHYRRAASDQLLARAELELEVRFRGVDFDVFATVLASLNAGKLATGPGTITQTVSAIMDADLPPAVRAGGRGRPGRASLIRLLTFVDGARTSERFYRKWPLARPFRARNPHALDYRVVLSAEEELRDAFASDSGALIRVKLRASFPAGGWRVDMTVARRIQGSDAQTSLASIVQTMFRSGVVTPANMLDMLGLSDADSEARGLYAYEIELERLPADPDAARPSAVRDLADQLLRLAKPEFVEEAALQAEIYRVAQLVVAAPGEQRRFQRDWGLKKLVPQVAALTRGEYSELYPPTGYFLLDKADGVRAIASARDGRLQILADVLLTFDAPEGTPPAATTVVDGELVRAPARPGAPPGPSAVFHAFDVIAVGGETVAADGYETRVARLGEAVKILRAFGLDARAKPVVHLTANDPAGLKAQFCAPVFEGRPYETDGRILVEPGRSYRDTRALKWKSLWNTTIDFLARRPPAAAMGRAPFADAPGHELHFLFVGINPQLFEALGLTRILGYSELFGTGGGGSYFPIQFSPSDAPRAFLYQHPTKAPEGEAGRGWVREIDGKVVELRCAAAAAAGSPQSCPAAGALGAPDWQLVRVRADRAREIRSQQYFGNDFRIAELTWLNYVDPFPEAQLWEGSDLGYFAAPKSERYRAQTAFTSFAKSRRIETDLAHARWVVDAAVGKGQDLGRYIRAEVRHVVGIDKDRAALSELVRRKFSHARRRGHGRRGRRGRRAAAPTTLFVLQADLTDPFAGTAAKVRSIAGFPEGGADAVVVNLAFHYFTGNVVNVRNFIALCRALVKIGGTVVITTMFGHRVHALLAREKIATGRSWDAREDGVLKHSIRRDYAEDELTEAGQRIGVLLPFSNGEYYEEFLVNVGMVSAEFEARGFERVAAPTFDALFADFKTRNPAMSQALTAADREFLSLYGELVFRRADDRPGPKPGAKK